jgi:hypothetical protein
VVLAADAGVTSEYRRKLEATVEMPLDADVFRVPPGYNAPQQVAAAKSPSFFFSPSLLLSLLPPPPPPRVVVVRKRKDRIFPHRNRTG